MVIRKLYSYSSSLWFLTAFPGRPPFALLAERQRTSENKASAVALTEARSCNYHIITPLHQYEQRGNDG